MPPKPILKVSNPVPEQERATIECSVDRSKPQVTSVQIRVADQVVGDSMRTMENEDGTFSHYAVVRSPKLKRSDRHMKKVLCQVDWMEKSKTVDEAVKVICKSIKCTSTQIHNFALSSPMVLLQRKI